MGLHGQADESGEDTVGDEGFRTVDDIAVAVAAGRGPDALQVRAGTGFGHGDGPHPLAPRHQGEPGAFLLLASVGEYIVRHDALDDRTEPDSRAGRLAGGERDLAAIQVMPQPLPERLEEGFLARPAVEEAPRPLAPRQAHVGAALVAREQPHRDVVGVGERADLFDVYAHLAPLGEGLGGDPAAVRDVEAQVALPRAALERGLAVRLVDELQRFGRSAEPLAEELAQPRARHDVAAAPPP